MYQASKKYLFGIGIGLFFVVLSTPVAHALTITIHIPEKYTDVSAGERIYFEVDVKFPENPTRQDLRLFYEITHNGEVVATAQFLKAIETQASFIDYIVLPENVEPGLHIITARIQDYADLEEEVFASFHVVGSEADQLRLYFFVLLGAILLVGLLVIMSIVSMRRKL